MRPAGRQVDFALLEWDTRSMKAANPKKERKSPGTLIVEKYRPAMNKLTAIERERLLGRAMQIAYGDVRFSTTQRVTIS